jgi:dynein heavy chain
MDCFCGLKTVKFESEGSTFTSGMISVDAETVPWF